MVVTSSCVLSVLVSYIVYIISTLKLIRKRLLLQTFSQIRRTFTKNFSSNKSWRSEISFSTNYAQIFQKEARNNGDAPGFCPMRPCWLSAPVKNGYNKWHSAKKKRVCWPSIPEQSSIKYWRLNLERSILLLWEDAQKGRRVSWNSANFKISNVRMTYPLASIYLGILLSHCAIPRGFKTGWLTFAAFHLNFASSNLNQLISFPTSKWHPDTAHDWAMLSWIVKDIGCLQSMCIYIYIYI